MDGAKGDRGERGRTGKDSHSARTLFILLAVVMFVFFGASEFQRHTDLVNGCERANVSRQVQSDFIGYTSDAREQSANNGSDPAQIKIDAQAVRNYQMLQDDLIESSSEFAVKEGSVAIDCDKAVPWPFPFKYPPFSIFFD